MRRAMTFVLLTVVASIALAPAPAHVQGGGVRVINAIGLVDYYRKPAFKPGDWVRYQMTGSSELGMKDDYAITLLIAGEEEFWGEECFWVETISEKDGMEILSVASLVSYAVFDDPEAITAMKYYVRKQINTLTESGNAKMELVRRPSTMNRARETMQNKLEYYIDSLGTKQMTIAKGTFDCEAVLFKQAAGGTVDFADSSRYDEFRENRTVYRNLDIPITSIVVEEIESIVSRKTWVRGQSTDAETIIRDRALGRAEAIEWGHGRRSRLLPEVLQKPLAEQRAEKRRSGRNGAG
jgi:hypothetical protein